MTTATAQTTLTATETWCLAETMCQIVERLVAKLDGEPQEREMFEEGDY